MQRKYTKEEMLQKKFGRLTPIEFFHRDNRAYWKCLCDCGNIVERRETYLIKLLVKHQERQSSCGCSHPLWISKSNKHPLWRGVGDISGHYINGIKSRAEKQELEFAVNNDYLWNLFVQQEYKCALTGLPLSFSTLRQRQRGIEQTASLDRIDSSKGYIEGNVQWIHKDVNLMKNHFPQERFFEVCKLVIEKRESQLPIAA